MNEIDEVLEIVDENSNAIGKATRGECYKKGLLHRAVNIFIFNSQGEVFITKRSNKKLIYPGKLDISSGEHLKPDEIFLEAAKRGLKEELGINIRLEKIRPLHRIDSTGRTEDGIIRDNELLETYKGIYDGEFTFDHGEVNRGEFVSFKQVEEMIKENKSQFTAYFLDEWAYLINLY